MLEDDPLSDYLTEQEQIELLKGWIKQYSRVILFSVLFAILCISGWRIWQQRQIKIQTRASHVYDEMLSARSQNDLKATNTLALKLTNKFSKTIYADFARLMLARDAINQQKYDQGSTSLVEVMDHGSTAGLRQIARLRLARVYLTMHLPQKSLDILTKIDDNAFSGLIEEIKGDAYLQLNKNDLAKSSYQAALKLLPNAESARPLLQMKLDNLATGS